MNDQPRSSQFGVLFESALQDYERQTGIVLAQDPLAKRLEDCYSVESVVGVLRERAPAFGGDSDGGRIVKALEGVVSVLHTLSNSAVLSEVTDTVRHKTRTGVTCL